MRRLARFALISTLWLSLNFIDSAHANGAKNSGEIPPDAKDVARADAWAMNLDTPILEGPIKSSERYYWGTKHDGHKAVEGILLSPELLGRTNPSAAGLHIVTRKTAPAPMDGGCSVIHIGFDLVTAQGRARCNYNFSGPPQELFQRKQR